MEHDHDQDSTDSPMARDTSGDSVPVRSERPVDSQSDQNNDAPTETRREHQPDLVAGISPDELLSNPVYLSQVTAYLQENHLHLPLLTPDPGIMARMRRETPELYKEYIATTRRASKADYVQRTSPYTQPSKDVRFGQICGLIVVIFVLGLAGYALYLDRPWIAGIITALDVVALAAIFANGNNKDNGNED